MEEAKKIRLDWSRNKLDWSRKIARISFERCQQVELHRRSDWKKLFIEQIYFQLIANNNRKLELEP